MSVDNPAEFAGARKPPPKSSSGSAAVGRARSNRRARSVDSDHEWLDQDAGPLVRGFALTRGKPQPDGTLFDLLSYVLATGNINPSETVYLQPEHKKILTLTAEPISVAELASKVDLALGVVRVLLADLAELGAISTYRPPPADEVPQDDLLQAVINGLQAL
jgi:hypothetical protein